MPIYEYRCASNGRVVEVQHKMAEKLNTWGELCDRAGIEPGRTELAAPVEKLISAGFISTGAAAAQATGCDAPACGMGACGSGMCGAGEP